MTIPAEITTEVTNGNVPERTVRDILGWFGKSRRGVNVVRRVHAALAAANLRTSPSFETAYLDETVRILREDQLDDDDLVQGGSVEDPIIRVSAIAAAHRELVTITRDEPIARAVTLMMRHDYSQLPVTQDRRRVDGLVSWRSLGHATASGQPPTVVREAMEPVEIVAHDAPLSEVVRLVLDREVVLVLGQDQTIRGMLTAYDVAAQFQSLAEPFLAVGEIENQVRRLIDGRFTLAQLNAAKHDNDDGRVIAAVADLTFGEYIRLLQNDTNWQALGLQLDRATFIEMLDSVREIRNDVMHFDPDGIDDETRAELRRARLLLQRLRPTPA